jgi:hypothetical protein
MFQNLLTNEEKIERKRITRYKRRQVRMKTDSEYKEKRKKSSYIANISTKDSMPCGLTDNSIYSEVDRFTPTTEEDINEALQDMRTFL